ncbi:16S rRNA (cytidine(1402)-2'-O)-methyltransferase [Spirochaeta thermophila]|uniref:Ribosomal RNA small subunit methyltransferase I n=1 Tax=Winmispira thermophila (strain ATCC 49972 / DSM 6192 / RI 19.B1) TaxID=665571 RepID=E0RND6_WINT6|nr:16S rRNA (cytidine(1402)-2'-O)-methyltransferase [Spirochaeta thermophila]ADN01136.1 hypothetical protein STHERM_c01600 [Spirochaeta thermophila DSM 6192]
MASLFVVATPIGNLEDITLRALRVLKEVSLIACEDTRRTRILLSHYGIATRTISYHSHKREEGVPPILSALEEGKDVAYVTDAGTPALSDPGAFLVAKVREAGFRVVPVPGPSAFTTLVSASGIEEKTITFEGFLSPKQGRRRRRLAELLDRGEAFFLYEAPHRILKLLDDLSVLSPDRTIVVGRELTKIHEEILSGTPEEVATSLKEGNSVRGEFSVLVCGTKKG